MEHKIHHLLNGILCDKLSNCILVIMENHNKNEGDFDTVMAHLV